MNINKGDIVAWLIVENNDGSYNKRIVTEQPAEPRFPALSWIVPLHAGKVSPRRAAWLADEVYMSDIGGY